MRYFSNHLIYLRCLSKDSFPGTSGGYFKCNIQGTNNELRNRFYKCVHLQLFSIKYKFVHLQLFNGKYKFVHLQLFDVKCLFSEKHMFHKHKRTVVYGRASLAWKWWPVIFDTQINYFPPLRFRPPWQVFTWDRSPFSNPLIVHSQFLGEANGHVFCRRKKIKLSILKNWQQILTKLLI